MTADWRRDVRDLCPSGRLRAIGGRKVLPGPIPAVIAHRAALAMEFIADREGRKLPPIRLDFNDVEAVVARTITFQFACCPAPNCPLQTKLDVYVCGRGLRTSSTTRPQYFDRSIKMIRGAITTRWNFRTAKSCF